MEGDGGGGVFQAAEGGGGGGWRKATVGVSLENPQDLQMLPRCIEAVAEASSVICEDRCPEPGAFLGLNSLQLREGPAQEM